jgi:cytochrome c oxidase accessory protein FixG
MEFDTQRKSRPKLQRLPPLPPPGTLYHRLRKRVHLLCFLVFLILPFFNMIRFDLPRQRFYFAGFALGIDEFAILFFTMMFLMFLVAASAVIHGRIYCSYMCPQMIFSEWSQAVEAWTGRLVKKRFPAWNPEWKARTAQGVFYAILGLASIFLAFIFTSYFIEPRDLLARLLRFDIQTAGGITGATVTILTFLDFTLVRQRFCISVCPYGYLQGMLQDKNTLLVLYRDGEKDNKVCIECGKCVRVCAMGIDIRNSPYQIECVHCGDCVDACEEVLRKIGRPGLIHYAWGEKDQLDRVTREAWYRRLGFRDAKRVSILLVLMFYFCWLTVALSMRRPVMVRLAPDRTRLYQVLPDGRVTNLFRVNLVNRSGHPTFVRFSVEDLPQAEIGLEKNPFPLDAGETVERIFEVRVRPWAQSQDVNHFRFMAQRANGESPQVFEMTFILPLKKE